MLVKSRRSIITSENRYMYPIYFFLLVSQIGNDKIQLLCASVYDILFYGQLVQNYLIDFYLYFIGGLTNTSGRDLEYGNIKCL